MEVKLLEVRDHMTYMPAIAIRCTPANEAERYMLARAGYGVGEARQGKFVLFAPEADPTLQYSPGKWSDRTRATAHKWIRDHWEELEPGAVVDVRVILGEAETPARPDREAEARLLADIRGRSEELGW